MAEEVEHQPADGVPVGVGQLDLEQFVDLVDRGAAGHPEAAVGEALDLGGLDVVLVDDLPHDLLEEVLQGDEAGGAAVLVDDDRHVELVLLHLPEELGHLLLLRHEHRRPHQLPQGAVGAVALPGAADDVLQVDEAEDVVRALPVGRQPGVAGVDGLLQGLVDAGIGLHADHVGAGHHDLPHDGVAELEDRVDEPALLPLDDLLLGGDVGHRADVLLGRVGPLLQAFAREEDVGHADQELRESPQRREVGQPVHGPGQAQRRSLRVLHGVGLGGHLGDDEEDHDLHHGADQDAVAAEAPFGQDPDQRAGRQLADQQEQQDEVEGVLGLFEEGGEALGPPPALLFQRHGPDAVHPHEGRLGHGEERRRDQQEEDGDQRQPVAVRHLTGLARAPGTGP